jgi:hypothetical protein
MSQCEHLISEHIKRWESSLINDLRLAQARQELLLNAAQMNRDTSTRGKSELRSLSKLALALGSVIVVAYGVIRLVLV